MLDSVSNKLSDPKLPFSFIYKILSANQKDPGRVVTCLLIQSITYQRISCHVKAPFLTFTYMIVSPNAPALWLATSSTGSPSLRRYATFEYVYR